MISEITPALYSDVFENLESGTVRYCVVGSAAVVLHGYICPTSDLDIVIDPDPRESQRAMHALMLAGFVATIPAPINLLTVARMFDRTQREIDVFLRFQIPFEELWNDSRLAAVGDTVARIASLEHLVRAKQTTGKSSDIQDSEDLIELINSTEHPKQE